jgi:rhodanese-related sulfurtransferase
MMLRLFFLSISLIIFSCQNEAQTVSSVKVEILNLEQFKTKINEGVGVQILDVRTPEEWAMGVVNNAKQINIYDVNFTNKVEDQLSKDKPVVVYCQAGVRSKEAAKKLKDMGYKTVYDFSGGYAAWKNGRN